MAKPIDRQSFIDYCKRALGAPVIEINVDDDQVDDCVDVALQLYADYHFDATEKIYYKYPVTAQDKINKFITIPGNILGVVRVFPIGNSISASDGLFNIQYQIALNDLYTLASISLVPYYMAMQHLSLVEEMLVGQIPIRYNRHVQQLHLDFDWNKINVGQFLLVEAYQVVDPDQYTDAWNDRWLKKYCTQLIKQRWGTNMKKFSGVQLPGGVQFNGQIIYDEACQEISNMENDLINSYSLPVEDYIG